MDTRTTNTPPQASTALIFPVFRLGTIPSDIIFWVPFLLITAFILAVVHKETVFSFKLKVILVNALMREILRNWLTIPGNCGDWQVQSPCGGPAGWRFREELTLQFKSKVSLIASKIPSWSGSQSFVLVVPSTDWMRSTHIMEGN